MRRLVLGTRGSGLALAQSGWVAQELRAAVPGLEVELKVIKTSGDQDRTSPLSSFGGKGIFTREIEEELLRGDIDFAVHSLKDLPTELPPGLALCFPPKRADARDLLVSELPLADLPEGAVVGTGSARRRIQLAALRADLAFEEIRGNVPTRVRKWRQGEYQAIVLAAAGVARLGLEACGLKGPEARALSPEECLPAPGQGILGLEIREDDEQVRKVLSTIADSEATDQALAERAFLRRLEGGCNVPAGALAHLEGEALAVEAFLAVEGGQLARTTCRGRREDAEELGRRAAAELLGARA